MVVDDSHKASMPFLDAIFEANYGKVHPLKFKEDSIDSH